jgi:hypothetical protein
MDKIKEKLLDKFSLTMNIDDTSNINCYNISDLDSIDVYKYTINNIDYFLDKYDNIYTNIDNKVINSIAIKIGKCKDNIFYLFKNKIDFKD